MGPKIQRKRKNIRPWSSTMAAGQCSVRPVLSHKSCLQARPLSRVGDANVQQLIRFRRLQLLSSPCGGVVRTHHVGFLDRAIPLKSCSEEVLRVLYFWLRSTFLRIFFQSWIYMQGERHE